MPVSLTRHRHAPWISPDDVPWRLREFKRLLWALMDFGEPDSDALDALFLRSTKHAEVRVELCRAMLEAELFTLMPRAQADGADVGELVEVEMPAEVPFMVW